MTFKIASFSVNSAQGSAEIQLLAGPGFPNKTQTVLVRIPFTPEANKTQAENDAAVKLLARAALQEAAGTL